MARMASRIPIAVAPDRAKLDHPSLRLCRSLLLLAAGWGLLAATPFPAPADPLAGHQAFERGDYERAVVEWQSSADRGDAASQFGLGMLYEQGAGGLKQDYKRADFWYRKAAEQDYTEAEYRLGLIWAAGGDDCPRDFVEAYKWTVMAAKSKGIWGTAAAKLKNQLDKVLTIRERHAGEDRAAAWQASRAAKVSQTNPAPSSPGSTVASGTSSIAATLPPPAPSALPGGRGKPASGCPGWPFPTLPCTEEFPALPGAPR
jgi:hypothetical protein